LRRSSDSTPPTPGNYATKSRFYGTTFSFEAQQIAANVVKITQHDIGNHWNRNDIELIILEVAFESLGQPRNARRAGSNQRFMRQPTPLSKGRLIRRTCTRSRRAYALADYRLKVRA
jgi:hypothetical protein